MICWLAILPFYVSKNFRSTSETLQNNITLNHFYFWHILKFIFTIFHSLDRQQNNHALNHKSHCSSFLSALVHRCIDNIYFKNIKMKKNIPRVCLNLVSNRNKYIYRKWYLEVKVFSSDFLYHFNTSLTSRRPILKLLR